MNSSDAQETAAADGPVLETTTDPGPLAAESEVGPTPKSASRRWVVGVIVVAVVGVAGLGAQVVLLHKAMCLAADRAAWEASLDERTAERKRIEGETATARSALGKMKVEIEMADQELGLRQADVAALESVRQKVAKMREDLASASEQLAKAVAGKGQAEKDRAQAETQGATFAGEAKQLEQQRLSLTQSVAEARTTLTSLKKDLDEATAGRAERLRLESLAADLQRQITALDAQRNQLTKSVVSLEQQRAEGQTWTATVTVLRGEKAALDTSVADLKKQKDDLEKQAADCKRAADAARADQKTAEKNAGEVATRATAATKGCKDAEARLQQAREALAGAEAALQAKQTILTQKETELKAVEERLKKAREAEEKSKGTSSDSTDKPAQGGTQ